MPLFQIPPRTPGEEADNLPHPIPAEEVLQMDEAEWFSRVYQGEKAQLTLRAFLMGSGLGFFLAFMNVYTLLKVGWLLDVAITASIVSFAISSFLVKARVFRTGLTILETNCMQSTASAAGYTLGGTFGAALPAVLMLSVSPEHPKGEQFAWWILIPWVIAMAGLGISMAIPMKRTLINREKLRFPYGTAAAVTLQSFYSKGSEALLKARALMWTALASAVLPLLKDLNVLKTWEDGKLTRAALLPSHTGVFDFLPKITASQLDPKTGTFATKAFPLSAWNLSLDHSLLMVGSGVFVGLRTTVSMMLGGLLLAWGLGPIAMGAPFTNAMGQLVSAARGPMTAWKDIGIWWGSPLLVSYGLVTFALGYKTMLRSFSGFGKRGDEKKADPLSSVEPPISWAALGVLVSGTALVLMAWQFFQIPPAIGILGVFVSFFMCLVGARATGETSITPGNALGKIMQLTYGILIPQSTTANLMTTNITTGAGLGCADLLSDLRSGYLLGANPRRQFWAQFLGVISGSVACVLAYFLLVPDATPLLGQGDKPPQFAAPSAAQWKVVAELFRYGLGNLHPLAQQGIVVGVVVGSTFAIAEALFPKHKKWIPSATGIGLGMILPSSIPFSMFLGAVLGEIFKKAKPELSERYSVPMASGAIAGESIVGVVVAALNNFVFV